MFWGTPTEFLFRERMFLPRPKAFTLEDVTGVKCQGYGFFDNIIPKK